MRIRDRFLIMSRRNWWTTSSFWGRAWRRVRAASQAPTRLTSAAETLPMSRRWRWPRRQSPLGVERQADVRLAGATPRSGGPGSGSRCGRVGRSRTTRRPARRRRRPTGGGRSRVLSSEKSRSGPASADATVAISSKAGHDALGAQPAVRRGHAARPPHRRGRRVARRARRGCRRRDGRRSPRPGDRERRAAHRRAARSRLPPCGPARRAPGRRRKRPASTDGDDPLAARAAAAGGESGGDGAGVTVVDRDRSTARRCRR